MQQKLAMKPTRSTYNSLQQIVAWACTTRYDTLLQQLWLFNFVFQMSEEIGVNILNSLSLDNVNISDEVNRLVKMAARTKMNISSFLALWEKEKPSCVKLKKYRYLRNFFPMSKRFWAYLKIQMPFSENACFLLEIAKPHSLVKTNHRDLIFLLHCSEFTSLFKNVNKTKLEIADLKSLFIFRLPIIIYVGYCQVLGYNWIKTLVCEAYMEEVWGR